MLGFIFYRWSVGAAVRWGGTVRASIDLFRLDLYGKLGVRAPTDFTDERRTVAPAVNAALLYGHPIPDNLRAPPPTESQAEQSARRGPD